MTNLPLLARQAAIMAWGEQATAPSVQAAVEHVADAVLLAVSQVYEQHGTPYYSVCRCGHWKSDHDEKTGRCKAGCVPSSHKFEHYEFLHELRTANRPNLSLSNDTGEHPHDGPLCATCDGTGWCEGSPAFTCPSCKGVGHE